MSTLLFVVHSIFWNILDDYKHELIEKWHSMNKLDSLIIITKVAVNERFYLLLGIAILASHKARSPIHQPLYCSNKNNNRRKLNKALFFVFLCFTILASASFNNSSNNHIIIPLFFCHLMRQIKNRQKKFLMMQSRTRTTKTSGRNSKEWRLSKPRKTYCAAWYQHFWRRHKISYVLSSNQNVYTSYQVWWSFTYLTYD